jgi:hypothetical protein
LCNIIERPNGIVLAFIISQNCPEVSRSELLEQLLSVVQLEREIAFNFLVYFLGGKNDPPRRLW